MKLPCPEARLIVPAVIAMTLVLPPATFPAFTLRLLGDSASGLGGFRETLSPADLDGDGDPGFFSGNGKGGGEWWFENRGAGDFRPHPVSDSNDADVGAAAADLDGDGDIDILGKEFGGYHLWLENRRIGGTALRPPRDRAGPSAGAAWEGRGALKFLSGVADALGRAFGLGRKTTTP